MACCRNLTLACFMLAVLLFFVITAAMYIPKAVIKANYRETTCSILATSVRNDTCCWPGTKCDTCASCNRQLDTKCTCGKGEKEDACFVCEVHLAAVINDPWMAISGFIRTPERGGIGTRTDSVDACSSMQNIIDTKGANATTTCYYDPRGLKSPANVPIKLTVDFSRGYYWAFFIACIVFLAVDVCPPCFYCMRCCCKSCCDGGGCCGDCECGCCQGGDCCDCRDHRPVHARPARHNWDDEDFSNVHPLDVRRRVNFDDTPRPARSEESDEGSEFVELERGGRRTTARSVPTSPRGKAAPTAMAAAVMVAGGAAAAQPNPRPRPTAPASAPTTPRTATPTPAPAATPAVLEPRRPAPGARPRQNTQPTPTPAPAPAPAPVRDVRPRPSAPPADETDELPPSYDDVARESAYAGIPPSRKASATGAVYTTQPAAAAKAPGSARPSNTAATTTTRPATYERPSPASTPRSSSHPAAAARPSATTAVATTSAAAPAPPRASVLSVAPPPPLPTEILAQELNSVGQLPPSFDEAVRPSAYATLAATPATTTSSAPEAAAVARPSRRALPSVPPAPAPSASTPRLDASTSSSFDRADGLDDRSDAEESTDDAVIVARPGEEEREEEGSRRSRTPRGRSTSRPSSARRHSLA